MLILPRLRPMTGPTVPNSRRATGTLEIHAHMRNRLPVGQASFGDRLDPDVTAPAAPARHPGPEV